MPKFWENLNSKFFYKVFSVITVIILVCSLTISLAMYYRFNLFMSKQNRDFIRYTSNQVKGDIINLTKKCEWLAGNIYSDSRVGILLTEDYYEDQDYSLFELINTIAGSLQQLKDNNHEISSISIYKLDPNPITNGKEIKAVKEFKNQELIKSAIEAKGNNVWATYRDNNGNYTFCLLKFLNINRPGGVLVIELKEESFSNLYKTGVDDKNNLFIVDKDNTVISSDERDSMGKDISTIIKGYSSQDAVTKDVLYNNTPYFFHTDRVNSQWRIIMIYDSYEVEKEKRNMEYYLVILTCIFMFIGLIFSLFLASGFASQMDKLMAKIKEIKKGNLQIKPSIKKVNEFYQLDKILCTMAHSIENLNADIINAIKQKEESDIKFLQMQINPHFLYNQLSIIRWIAYEEKQTKITHIVDNLSNFYRISLSKGNEVINIRDEINLMKSYIELQNLCSDSPINLHISVDESLSGMKISKMTLQPFVENAVIHGKLGGRELNINIDVVAEDAGLVKIRIDDDGAGITEEVEKYIDSLNEKGLAIEGKHYGITNTITRLRLLYKDKGEVKIHAFRKNQGTLIEITLKN